MGNQYVCFRDRSEVVIPYVCLKHVKELDVGMAEPDYEITSDRPLVEVEIAIEQSSGLLVRKHTRVVAILLDLSMPNQWGGICYRELDLNLVSGVFLRFGNIVASICYYELCVKNKIDVSPVRLRDRSLGEPHHYQ